MWAAFDAIAGGDSIIDEFSVIEWLERHGRLGEVNGGALAIQQLSTAASPDYDHMCEQWAQDILDDSKRRTQIAHAQAEAMHGYYPNDAGHRANMEREQRYLDDIRRRQSGESDTAPTYEPLGVSMADVIAEDMHWLWLRRIAFGRLAEFLGDGGVGKSLATIDIVKRHVTGEAMPDGEPGTGEPGSAVMVCAEDSLETVKRRFEAAGVSSEDMARIRAIASVPERDPETGVELERSFSLLTDSAALEATIVATGATLLVIDPITAYLGDGVDERRDPLVRRVLAPLKLLAERHGVAVILVRHLNRNGSASAQHRGLGSVAFTNLARLGLMFAPNPDTEGEVLVGRHKGNYGAPPPTLAFRITQVGEDENMPRLTWLGERDTTVETALAAQTGTSADSETRSATSVAVEWLIIYLADGPQLVNQIVADAIDAQIIEKGHLKPLRTASERVCLKPPRKNGMSGGWEWELDPAKVPYPGERASSASKDDTGPDFKPTPPKMPTTDTDGHLREKTPSKMPTPDNAGHLRADAVEFSADGALDGRHPSKMPTPHVIGTFRRAENMCPATGGSHIYAFQRTPDGRLICVECQQPAASIGA